MVARGDLGVEVALEEVPHIQKTLIAKARAQGRFVITATQMLESMTGSAVPTRAEVSDVANAIYDGTDAMMLSAETSTGKYPVESVRMMARIAKAAERSVLARAPVEPLVHRGETLVETIALSVRHASQAGTIRAIVVLTTSGASARLVARYRPSAPVYAFTPSLAVARQIRAVYGVQPVVMPFIRSTDDSITYVDRALRERGWLSAGDPVAIVAGVPMGRTGSTNLIKFHTLGEMS